MKKHVFIALFSLMAVSGLAQNDTVQKRGFQKEKLFTGGSVSLSFGNRNFLIGVNPVLGYSLAKWIDAGIAVNYIYTAQKDYYDDRYRQTIYGGGVFTRLFPVRFLFAQAQLEHNFIHIKYTPAGSGTGSYSDNRSATSLLVGPGYTTGRYPGAGNAYGYFAVLFDVLGKANSPYTDQQNHPVPVIRGGINVPLFQGRRR